MLHLDVDAFYASEEILDPSLKGKPLIVGARPEQRGVVASASYAIRAFGVRSAMPTAQALRLCPQAIVVPPRHRVYGEYSAQGDLLAVRGVRLQDGGEATADHPRPSQEAGAGGGTVDDGQGVFAISG
ncbi:MAG: hypothetical protein E3J21_06005 [Anaerolineales bacterium]|nr:MAG: hypothetical protein E3J21_06005 [Anaerolineales bacterium]